MILRILALAAAWFFLPTEPLVLVCCVYGLYTASNLTTGVISKLAYVASIPFALATPAYWWGYLSERFFASWPELFRMVALGAGSLGLATLSLMFGALLVNYVLEATPFHQRATVAMLRELAASEAGKPPDGR